MADQVGAKSSDMQAAENNFRQRVQDFDTAAANIRTAVENLSQSWKGQGKAAFDQAMLKWDNDMKTIAQDLTSLSDAVSKTDAAFQSLDADISKAFSGF